MCLLGVLLIYFSGVVMFFIRQSSPVQPRPPDKEDVPLWSEPPPPQPSETGVSKYVQSTSQAYFGQGIILPNWPVSQNFKFSRAFFSTVSTKGVESRPRNSLCPWSLIDHCIINQMILSLSWFLACLTISTYHVSILFQVCLRTCNV